MSKKAIVGKEYKLVRFPVSTGQRGGGNYPSPSTRYVVLDEDEEAGTILCRRLRNKRMNGSAFVSKEVRTMDGRHAVFCGLITLTWLVIEESEEEKPLWAHNDLPKNFPETGDEEKDELIKEKMEEIFALLKA